MGPRRPEKSVHQTKEQLANRGLKVSSLLGPTFSFRRRLARFVPFVCWRSSANVGRIRTKLARCRLCLLPGSDQIWATSAQIDQDWTWLQCAEPGIRKSVQRPQMSTLSAEFGAVSSLLGTGDGDLSVPVLKQSAFAKGCRPILG